MKQDVLNELMYHFGPLKEISVHSYWNNLNRIDLLKD